MSSFSRAELPAIARTLPEALRWHASATPDGIACHFIRDGLEQDISYAALLSDAERFARLLAERGIGRNDVVLILAPHDPVLMHAFIGAMLIGAIPAFIPPLTEKQDPAFFWGSIRDMTAHLGVAAWVWDGSTNPLTHLGESIPNVKAIRAREVRDIDGSATQSPSLDPSSTALLQFSSGTTGIRKGVMLTHAQVLEQICQLASVLHLSERDRIVSWLPLYHDMGLIACFLLPLYTGVPVVWLSPLEWVRKPAMLFDRLERHKGTLTWMPNFAFRHLAATVDPRQHYDLSQVRAFINCSESCKADTFAEFIDAFGHYGVSASQLQTCYAMAETVFAVTHSSLGDPIPVRWFDLSDLRCALPSQVQQGDAKPYLSVGKLLPEFSLRIASDDDPCAADGSVGEIWLAGPCLSQGYYRNPNATQANFRDGWYATGDLGFLWEGELYIVGRKKEIIIVHGRNYFAHDIEAIANEVQGVHRGRIVAIGMEDVHAGSEEVLLLVEVESPVDAGNKSIQRALKDAISNRLGVVPRVRFVPPRWLIKTTSGKIDRQANKLKYLNQGVTHASQRSESSAALA